MEDNIILQKTLEEFEHIAKIPRKSGHEKKVSDFLKKRAEDFGCTAIQDEKYNLIIDKKATKGYENSPLIVMQAHMDMVCVAEEGMDFDPVTSSIELINDGKFLRANGTTLGADDGIGVAGIMFILGNDFAHGPLRAIFTVDEEVGMTGAIEVDKKYLKDAKYLINCDSEQYDVLTTSSAGGCPMECRRKISYIDTKHKYAYKFTIKDLKGGHSGDAINRGFLNAIKLTGQFIREAKKLGEISLCNIQSLKAHNVIPSDCTIIFTSDLELADFDSALNYIEEFIEKGYGSVEDNSTIILETTPLPAKVMDISSENDILKFINLAMTGVLKMSQKEKDLVEVSSNIGPIKILDEEVIINVFPRAQVDVFTYEMVEIYKDLAKLCNMDISVGFISPAWPIKENSHLQNVAKEVFKKQNDFDIKIKSIHAGLETSYFYEKNPNLDIISIGPNNYDIHSPKERLELSTVAPYVKLLWGIIEKLK